MLIAYEASTEYIVKNNYGVSALVRPENHTVLFIMKKIEARIKHLYECEDCFVFYQRGIEIPEDLMTRHIFCEVENAAAAFAMHVQEVYGAKISENRKRKYIQKDGSFIGENVSIGEGTYIAPGCLIDHDVVIGKNCVIGFGAVLKNCTIGNECTIYEYAMIGTESFNYHVENDKKVRTIAVGDVIVQDNVDIGAYTVVDRGTLTHTFIGKSTKIDGNTRIAHDAHIEAEVIITACCLISAYAEIKRGAAVYAASVMKGIVVGENVKVGAFSGVIKDIPDNVEVFGYPARIIKK